MTCGATHNQRLVIDDKQLPFTLEEEGKITSEHNWTAYSSNGKKV